MPTPVNPCANYTCDHNGQCVASPTNQGGYCLPSAGSVDQCHNTTSGKCVNLTCVQNLPVANGTPCVNSPNVTCHAWQCWSGMCSSVVNGTDGNNCATSTLHPLAHAPPPRSLTPTPQIISHSRSLSVLLTRCSLIHSPSLTQYSLADTACANHTCLNGLCKTTAVNDNGKIGRAHV